MNLKTNILLFIVILSLLAGCQNSNYSKHKQLIFSGNWATPENSDYSFYLDIQQIGENITGGYCGYPFNLSQVDCPNGYDSSKCNVFGKIIHDTAFINFVSCYSGDTGKAKLFLDDTILVWKTVFDPSKKSGNWNGAPSEANLYKNIVAKLKGKDTTNFEGMWSFPRNKNYGFSIDVIQDGSRIYGQYAADSANKRFCSFGTDSTKCAFEGRVRNDTAFIKFYSCKTCDSGSAIIYVQKKGVLHWKTIFNPHPPRQKDWNGILRDFDLKPGA